MNLGDGTVSTTQIILGACAISVGIAFAIDYILSEREKEKVAAVAKKQAEKEQRELERGLKRRAKQHNNAEAFNRAAKQRFAIADVYELQPLERLKCAPESLDRDTLAQFWTVRQLKDGLAHRGFGACLCIGGRPRRKVWVQCRRRGNKSCFERALKARGAVEKKDLARLLHLLIHDRVRAVLDRDDGLNIELMALLDQNSLASLTAVSRYCRRHASNDRLWRPFAVRSVIMASMLGGTFARCFRTVRRRLGAAPPPADVQAMIRDARQRFRSVASLHQRQGWEAFARLLVDRACVLPPEWARNQGRAAKAAEAKHARDSPDAARRACEAAGGVSTFSNGAKQWIAAATRASHDAAGSCGVTITDRKDMRPHHIIGFLGRLGSAKGCGTTYPRLTAVALLNEYLLWYHAQVRRGGNLARLEANAGKLVFVGVDDPPPQQEQQAGEGGDGGGRGGDSAGERPAFRRGDAIIYTRKKTGESFGGEVVRVDRGPEKFQPLSWDEHRDGPWDPWYYTISLSNGVEKQTDGARQLQRGIKLTISHGEFLRALRGGGDDRGTASSVAALGLDALLRYLRVHTEKLIERGTAKRAPGSPDRAAGPSSPPRRGGGN